MRETMQDRLRHFVGCMTYSCRLHIDTLSIIALVLVFKTHRVVILDSEAEPHKFSQSISFRLHFFTNTLKLVSIALLAGHGKDSVSHVLSVDLDSRHRRRAVQQGYPMRGTLPAWVKMSGGGSMLEPVLVGMLEQLLRPE
jgi:hypothetical protein